MKKIAAILILMFALKGHTALTDELKDKRLQAVYNILSTKDGAMLHSCGYISVIEFSEPADIKEIKFRIDEEAKMTDSLARKVSFNKVNKKSLDGVGSISGLPGWPPGIDEDKVEEMMEKIDENLNAWRKDQPQKLKDIFFEGSILNSENEQNDFYAIYDAPSLQLLMVSINASEVCGEH